jgi:hypothetical protein
LDFMPKTFYVFERDFTFSLEEVSPGLRAKEEFYSLEGFAQAFQSIVEEIELAFHPERLDDIRRSHGLIGLANPGLVDSDAYLYR